MNETECRNNTQAAMEGSAEQIKEIRSNGSEDVAANKSSGDQKRVKPPVTESKWSGMEDKPFDHNEATERAFALLSYMPKSYEIQATETGLEVCIKGNLKPLTNWFVLSIKIHANTDTAKDQAAVITVLNCDVFEIKTIEVTSKELSNSDWIHEKLGLKYTCSFYKFVRAYIDSLLPFAEEVETVTKPGWNGNTYARCSDCIGSDKITVATNGFEPVSAEISVDEKERTAAMRVFDTLLSCTRDNIAMMMLFFTLIISMLTSVFKRSGIARIPQYALGVIGVTGSGKTTLVKALLSFIKDYSYFDLSVGYTEAAFRKNLVIYRDTILLVDDLVDNNSSEATDNLKLIARLFGNSGSSHKTFNSDATADCRAIFTGEVEPLLVTSSLNRMLFVHVSREDIDFDRVTDMQKSETAALYARAISDLLMHVSEQGPDKVVKKLYASFLSFCDTLNQTHNGLCQRRVEAYSWILATEIYYREYCGEAENKSDSLFNYAVKSLKNDYIQTQYDMPEYVFCKTVVDNSSKFQNIDAQKPLESEKWGYSSQEYRYIVDDKQDKLLYSCDLQNINKKALIRSLIQKGIIKPYQGRGQKHRLSIRPVGDFRTYRLDIEEATKYISGVEECGK